MASENAFEPLLHKLPSFFDSSSFSDSTIRCGKKDFKLHRVILCAQSGYFTNMFTGEWKETKGAVTLEDEDACAVEAMFEFLYSFDYDSSGRAENSASPMVFDVKVYSVADKYDVPALKSLAKQKFATNVSTCWDMDDFPDAITQIYHSTPANDQGLREIVVEISCKNITQLLLKQRFRDVLEEKAAFASDIVQRLAGKPNSELQKYRCPDCAKHWEAILSVPGQSCYCIHCGNRRSDWASYCS